MKTLLVVGLVLALAGFEQDQSRGPGPDRLVGTWKLVSVSATSEGQVIPNPMGQGPTGALTYTRNGRMSALVSFGGRQPFSRTDRGGATVEERAEAFRTFFAYAGRYTLKGDKVIHHVEIASIPNWVNTDLVRDLVQFDRGRMTLRTPPMGAGDTQGIIELVWERLE